MLKLLYRHKLMNLKNFVEIILRGISQVFLLNNAITGILFLIGIFYNSWMMGTGAIIGVFVGTLTALFLKYYRSDINQGLYGYNGTLVGLAIVYFFGFNTPSVIAIFFGSILSSILMRVMSIRGMPPYTAPFIISTWIALSLLVKLSIIPLQMTQSPDADALKIIPAVSKGIGQVMFQGDTVTGIAFFIGLLISSRISALYALLGSVLGVIVAFAFSLPLAMINIGLFSFNGVLCGIAFSHKKWNSIIPAIVSIVISIFMTYGIINLGIIGLTSPFVISTWLVLLFNTKIKSIFYRRFEERKYP
ncbi:MAG: urea transporter [Candidatus Jettenia sp.]|nr:urea transporter [Candidatus Jettenia sp.]